MKILSDSFYSVLDSVKSTGKSVVTAACLTGMVLASSSANARYFNFPPIELIKAGESICADNVRNIVLESDLEPSSSLHVTKQDDGTFRHLAENHLMYPYRFSEYNMSFGNRGYRGDMPEFMYSELVLNVMTCKKDSKCIALDFETTQVRVNRVSHSQQVIDESSNAYGLFKDEEKSNFNYVTKSINRTGIFTKEEYENLAPEKHGTKAHDLAVSKLARIIPPKCQLANGID